MINEVEKFLFVGVKDEMDTFFARAQKHGFIEFIPASGVTRHEYPRHIQDLISAISILRKQPQGDHYVGDVIGAADVVDRILTLKKSLDALEEEQRLLNLDIARVTPLGDFSVEEVKDLHARTGRMMRFYSTKHELNRPDNFPSDLIFLATDHDLDYFMSFSEHAIHHHGLIEIHVPISLSSLKEKLENVKLNRAHTKEKLYEQTVYLELLKKTLLDDLNHFNLKTAKDEVSNQIEGALFSVEAWMPKKNRQEVEELLDGLAVHYEQIAIEKEDRIPTAMENRGVGAIGEDLVHIYDTPATGDKDPSKWVFFSFAFFFAVIIADAGYGCIYLLLGLFMKLKFKNPKPFLRRFTNLVLTLACTCIVWGVLISSFFGLQLYPGNPLVKYSLIGEITKKKIEYHIEHQDTSYHEMIAQVPALKDVRNAETFLEKGVVIKDGKPDYIIMKSTSDAIMLEFSILIGMIHVSLGLLRNLRKHWAGIGWVSAIFGSYLYFPKILGAVTLANVLGISTPPASFEIGLQMLGIGVLVSLILSFIQNKWGGLGEIVKSIEIFADVLSYLRLYALGLAAMILADTFNSIGTMVHFAFGFLIIIVGHCTNMVLGIMGGVIHGLRLNFLEWYHHCFEGGGRIFRPLRKITGDD